MNTFPWLVFFTTAGACVGSFLNVVAYRVPEGLSIVTPPSRCPGCEHKLAWYDNIPVLGWLFLRGKCRYCGRGISIQYPIVEAITAALFGLIFYVNYHTELRPAFAAAGFEATWPALLIQYTLLSCLIAATIVDARLFIIPLAIPWVASIVAIIGTPLAVSLGWLDALVDVVPFADTRTTWAAFGGFIGLVAAWGLLQTRMLPRSFDEVADEVTDPAPSDEFLDHPHPRREVLKECLFVVWPVVGALAGWWLTPVGAVLPSSALVAGGVVAGFLVGGGIVWGTRILGTLAFGKEAMGLGDVHLLAAVGAVLGALDTVFAFFIAPFLGIVGALAIVGFSAMAKGQVRIIPYGPYLAGGALLVMILREPLRTFFGI